MEILGAIALLIVETIIPIVVEVFFTIFVEYLNIFPFGSSRRERKFLKFGLVLVAGGFLGWLSALLHPSLLINRPTLQVLTLIVGPLAAGFCVEKMAAKIWKRKRDILRYGNFWNYFWFTLAFLAMRIEFYYRHLYQWH